MSTSKNASREREGAEGPRRPNYAAGQSPATRPRALKPPAAGSAGGRGRTSLPCRPGPSSSWVSPCVSSARGFQQPLSCSSAISKCPWAPLPGGSFVSVNGHGLAQKDRDASLLLGMRAAFLVGFLPAQSISDACLFIVQAAGPGQAFLNRINSRAQSAEVQRGPCALRPPCPLWRIRGLAGGTGRDSQVPSDQPLAQLSRRHGVDQPGAWPGPGSVWSPSLGKAGSSAARG